MLWPKPRVTRAHASRSFPAGDAFLASGHPHIRVETAREMDEAVEQALPADLAIFAAAVADWRVAEQSSEKRKKDGNAIPPLQLTENPDILARISRHADKRPRLVVGFAAETEKVLEHAKAKFSRKGCDLLVANDVSPASGVMGGIATACISSRRRRREPAGDGQERVANALIARFAEASRGADEHADPRDHAVPHAEGLPLPATRAPKPQASTSRPP